MNKGPKHSRIAGPIEKKPQALFRCLLDEQPTELLPKPSLAALKKLVPANDLAVNPCCFFASPELRSLPYLRKFFSPEDILWVLDPDMNALQPFWLGPELRSRLADLQPAQLIPADLPQGVVNVLRFAGVLSNQHDRQSRSRELAHWVAKAAAYFQKNRYVLMNRLLHPFHIAELRRYIRELARCGELAVGDDGYENCHLKHNETVARFFHYQLTDVVSKVIGELVQPSFAFLCSYHGGAELARHTDREQCEFTVSLCVDFEPEPKRVTGWPLYLETSRGRVIIEQALGDGILFCGREVPHYRHRLADGCTSTSILFHFVRRNFDGKLN